MGHRRSKKQAENESLMLQTLERIAKKRWKNSSETGNALGNSCHTIARRFNGGRSMAESREGAQLLNIPEEKALIEWITRLTITGHPRPMQLSEKWHKKSGSDARVKLTTKWIGTRKAFVQPISLCPVLMYFSYVLLGHILPPRVARRLMEG